MPWDKYAYEYAASHGHLKILEWLKTIDKIPKESFQERKRKRDRNDEQENEKKSKKMRRV